MFYEDQGMQRKLTESKNAIVNFDTMPDGKRS